MHLCIYDEWTKRKMSERTAIASIRTHGEPGQREWWVDVKWQTKNQHGEARTDHKKLSTVVERLQLWENIFQEMEILSAGTHMVVFCQFQLQMPVKRAFARNALPNMELSEHSVHFPSQLMDAYDGLPYA